MQIVADLHLHSKYSRAVSQNMTLPVMAEYAKKKGIDLLTASDWTHPLWFKEITGLLEEKSEGIYSLKTDQAAEPTRFLLSTEISSIYKQGEKLRRIHSLVFVPNLEIAEKVTKELLRRGANLSADGRPIIGLSAKTLLELVLEIDERSMLIPCHVWTPHFGVYGSASGFDSLEEAFGEMAPHIYAVETGLSSDPEMNWQIPELRTRSILSFSDAHSPAKMGREATVFLPKNEISTPTKSGSNDKFHISNVKYEDVRLAIMRKSPKLKVGYTIEFYPEEGKYHFSGHRNCKVSYGPEEIAAKGTMCPVCKKTMTEGVILRVQTLAGETYHPRAMEKKNEYGLKWFTDRDKRYPSYVKLVPLLEVVAESLESTVMSQKSKDMYESLCRQFGSELDVLLKVPTQDVSKFAGDKIAESIEKVRSGNIEIIPGFDGEYGIVKIWKEGEEVTTTTEADQLSLL
jgi:uncharacterized protein (TIGR00375 family)